MAQPSVADPQTRAAVPAAHLAIIDAEPAQAIDSTAARLLLSAYRRTRSALSSTRGSEGHLNFGVNWIPDPKGIGEPDPIADTSRVIHGSSDNIVDLPCSRDYRRRGSSVSSVGADFNRP